MSVRSAAAELAEQANASPKVDVAGFSLEGVDAIGRPFESAATADEFAEYGSQAAAISSRVGEYVRVHTVVAICICRKYVTNVSKHCPMCKSDGAMPFSLSCQKVMDCPAQQNIYR